MTTYKSPGIYIQETDWSTVFTHPIYINRKRKLYRILYKIGNIKDLEKSVWW